MAHLDEIGFIYKIFVDPALAPLHEEVLKLVGTNKKIIDLACGTGALALKMSKKAQSVLGIDLSKSQIKTAQSSKVKQQVANAEFFVKDITDLSEYKNQEFDLATISLALHQFSLTTTQSILLEIKRIAKEIIIVDYTCPMPATIKKTTTYILERMMGREHYNGFKEFIGVGGIKWHISQIGLTINYEKVQFMDIYCIVKCAGLDLENKDGFQNRLLTSKIHN